MFLTADEAAAALRCNADTVRRWIADKRIPAAKVGRYAHLRPDDTRAWANVIGVGTPRIEGKK